MRWTLHILIFCSIVLLLLTAGCRRETAVEETAVAPEQSVGSDNASALYLHTFGTPSVPKDSLIYALVGYYPVLSDDVGIRPFPLFLDAGHDRIGLVVRQILFWGDGWNLGGVQEPLFPPETELVEVLRDGDLVRIELTPGVMEGSDPLSIRQGLAVLSHTLTQFEGVDRVMVVSGGELLPYQAEKGFMPDPAELLPVEPPRQVGLAIYPLEGGGEGVTVYFDRPVSVETLAVADEGGQLLQGRLSQSMFGMVVSFTPVPSRNWNKGEKLQLGWKVQDGMGRPGQGQETFSVNPAQNP